MAIKVRRVLCGGRTFILSLLCQHEQTQRIGSEMKMTFPAAYEVSADMLTYSFPIAGITIVNELEPVSKNNHEGSGSSKHLVTSCSQHSSKVSVLHSLSAQFCPLDWRPRLPCRRAQANDFPLYYHPVCLIRGYSVAYLRLSRIHLQICAIRPRSNHVCLTSFGQCSTWP